jgi:hypothetical protein
MLRLKRDLRYFVTRREMNSPQCNKCENRMPAFHWTLNTIAKKQLYSVKVTVTPNSDNNYTSSSSPFSMSFGNGRRARAQIRITRSPCFSSQKMQLVLMPKIGENERTNCIDKYSFGMSLLIGTGILFQRYLMRCW